MCQQYEYAQVINDAMRLPKEHVPRWVSACLSVWWTYRYEYTVESQFPSLLVLPVKIM